MDFAAVIVIQVLYAIASLALISVGLAVIFGMMRVINFAHGEFLMMGGYTVILSTHAGINRWVSMLVLAPLVVGLVGMLVEWLIIRHLYGRVIETVLATWGLSLFLMGLATVTVGFYQEGILPPFGPVRIGAYKEGGYTFFVIGVTALILIGVYALMRYTWFGLIARGTMQNADMAAALGTDTRKVYALTFGFGAALSGLAGAIMAPISGVVPVVGMTYIAKAFITVISGGATVLAGTVSAAGLLGLVNQAVTFVTTPVIGEVALLASAIMLLRILPTGITGRFFRRGL
ncbi:MAG TPA: branched-chain amino acid ABC transporter permease [Alphaproteobacteria bacterium]|nr:branched-chain amino acid ABC transporter permease [Alphaproteobacteria bacterium]HJM50171.1 branched-chain amino acid ABC transporter permease [Alphaproteobacteria bacterium]